MRTHPDERVVGQVAGVRQLPADGRDLLPGRPTALRRAQGGLEVLEPLAEPHDCACPGDQSVHSPHSFASELGDRDARFLPEPRADLSAFHFAARSLWPLLMRYHASRRDMFWTVR